MKSRGSNGNLGDSEILRLNVTIQGAVQGVGFRPFVYRLANELHLTGWVTNTVHGVLIQVEGRQALLDEFLLRLRDEKPPISFIQSLESSFLDPVGYSSFDIKKSESAGTKTALILPDIATCPDCLSEIFNPVNRRHLYPFTNCTNCGPRFTIIESLPYDRPNTSMRKFTMCPECHGEYENPTDRRFHAQPIACPLCGPRVELWNQDGRRISENLHAMLEAVDEIRRGKIVAVKGLGGFHLMVDAGNENAIARLRERKHREEKPLALMYPSLERIREDCSVSLLEERLLHSPESPIVLIRGKSPEVELGIKIALQRLAPNIAPSNPYLGVMLPYTPLHHILLRELKNPVVATSGNISDEPICTDENDALERLRSIADMFLVHNRPIVRHVDDSIVRILLGRELVLRRARGYAPLPVHTERTSRKSIVAVGAHLKNSIAVSSGPNVFISQHIGDLETTESYNAFQRALRDFQQLYDIQDSKMVCDLHPDYLSSKYAHSHSTDVSEVQHHYAHIASCMAENHLEGSVLGVSWDGTGFGLDGSIWGGEFLATNETKFERVASFLQFRLPGGEKAIKEPRRAALGILFEIVGSLLFSLDDIHALKSFSEPDLEIIHQMLVRRLNSPLTSSVGRLFDGVAAIIGLRQTVRFEGQAAMGLEFLTSGIHSDDAYDYELKKSSTVQRMMLVDWKPMILAIMDDVRRSVNTAIISARFHNTLVKSVLDVAANVGLEKVVLSGGCFQNAYLTERCVLLLRKRGFRPYWHQRVPPNDGGIALGQIFAVTRLNTGKKNDKTTTLAEEVAQ